MVVDERRFEAKIDRSGDHHVWLGALSSAGAGQVRVDGRLQTAARVAYELAHGPVAGGYRVVSCLDDQRCVRIDHLGLEVYASKAGRKSVRRAAKGGGSIESVSPGVWKIGVTAGVNAMGKRRRTFRTVHGTRSQAAKALAALVIDVGDGSKLQRSSEKQLTLEGLVDWYLRFAAEERGLEQSTLIGYATAYTNWFRDQIGNRKASSITVGDLDNAFGRMRRAGLSRSRMNNARSLLSGAYKWGKRHGKATSNPVEHFELPTSKLAPRHTTAPELADLLHLLEVADEYDEILAPVLKLGATTGLRRGELAGLRRDRLQLDRRQLVVDNAVNDAGGVVVEKQPKTRTRRVVSVDEATVILLQEHLRQMDVRAAVCGTTVAADGFVFSLDPACAAPMRPELMTRRMRQLRTEHGLTDGTFDATILALRKWTSSELMDAGFNPSAVSGRQGHTVQVMLHHYSTRRQSADRAAADHLGQRVHGKSEDGPSGQNNDPADLTGSDRTT